MRSHAELVSACHADAEIPKQVRDDALMEQLFEIEHYGTMNRHAELVSASYADAEIPKQVRDDALIHRYFSIEAVMLNLFQHLTLMQRSRNEFGMTRGLTDTSQSKRSC